MKTVILVFLIEGSGKRLDSWILRKLHGRKVELTCTSSTIWFVAAMFLEDTIHPLPSRCLIRSTLGIIENCLVLLLNHISKFTHEGQCYLVSHRFQTLCSCSIQCLTQRPVHANV